MASSGDPAPPAHQKTSPEWPAAQGTQPRPGRGLGAALAGSAAPAATPGERLATNKLRTVVSHIIPNRAPQNVVVDSSSWLESPDVVGRKTPGLLFINDQLLIRNDHVKFPAVSNDDLQDRQHEPLRVSLGVLAGDGLIDDFKTW